MSKQRPIILNQAGLDWETWDDPDLAAKSPMRWKILISGERGLSSGVATGIKVNCQDANVKSNRH